jgi:hypothetical protein
LPAHAASIEPAVRYTWQPYLPDGYPALANNRGKGAVPEFAVEQLGRLATCRGAEYLTEVRPDQA